MGVVGVVGCSFDGEGNENESLAAGEDKIEGLTLRRLDCSFASRTLSRKEDDVNILSFFSGE